MCRPKPNEHSLLLAPVLLARLLAVAIPQATVLAARVGLALLDRAGALELFALCGDLLPTGRAPLAPPSRRIGEAHFFKCVPVCWLVKMHK